MSDNNDFEINVNVRPIIDAIFRREDGISTMAFEVYKSIYRRNRKAFKIIGGIHQNNLMDILHFSVEIDIANGWFHRLHFNGYLQKEFIVCNITSLTTSNGIEKSEVVWKSI